MFKLLNQQKIKSALYIGLIAGLLTSCGKDNVSHSDYIPNNAFAVVSVNTEAIVGDAFFDLLTNNSLSIDFASGPLSGIMKDPSNAGIKSLNKFYFFAVGEKIFEGKVGAVLPLNDSEKLAQYIKHNFECEVNKDNGFSVAKISAEHNLVWDDNTAIYFFGAFGGDLVKEAQTLFKQTPEQSLAIKDSTFSFALNSEAHISTWINNDKFLSFIDEGLSMAMNYKLLEKLNVTKDDMLGSKSIFLTNFNKGNITIDQRQYLSQNKIKKYQGFQKKNNILGLTSMASKEDPIMMASVSLKSEGLIDLLKDYKLDALWDAQMAKLPNQIKIDQLAQFFSGDVLVLLNDIEKVKQIKQVPGLDDEGEDIMETKEITIDRPQLTAGLTLKNAQLFKLFLNTFATFLPVVDGFSSFNNELFFAVKGDFFFLTTSQKGIKSLNKMNGKLNLELSSLVANNRTSIYLNTAQLLNKAGDFFPVKIEGAENLKNIIISEHGDFSKGFIQGKTTLNFNGEENGLISIFKLISNISKPFASQLGSVL